MNKILKYIKVIVFTGLTAMPALAGAIAGPSAPGVSGPLPQNIDDVFCTIVGILDYLFYALILLTIFFVIMAAFKYLTSGGDPEKVKESNKQLLYAAAAIVTGVLAYGIPRIAASIIGGRLSTAGACL